MFLQVMQFGRIDTNAYTLDFQYPFSAIQAFAVALANVTQRLKWSEMCNDPALVFRRTMKIKHYVWLAVCCGVNGNNQYYLETSSGLANIKRSLVNIKIIDRHLVITGKHQVIIDKHQVITNKDQVIKHQITDKHQVITVVSNISGTAKIL